MVDDHQRSAFTGCFLFGTRAWLERRINRDGLLRRDVVAVDVGLDHFTLSGVPGRS